MGNEKVEMASPDHGGDLAPPNTAHTVQHHDSMLNSNGKDHRPVHEPLVVSNGAEIDPFLVGQDPAASLSLPIPAVTHISRSPGMGLMTQGIP